jgi:hypothetical protein
MAEDARFHLPIRSETHTACPAGGTEQAFHRQILHDAKTSRERRRWRGKAKSGAIRQ